MDLNLRLLIKAIADVAPVKKVTEATDAIAQGLKEVTEAAKAAGQGVADGVKDMLGGAAGGQVTAGAEIAEDLGKATSAAREASTAIRSDLTAIADTAVQVGDRFIKVTAAEIQAMGGWEAFEKAVKNGALDGAKAIGEEAEALNHEAQAAEKSSEANKRNADSNEKLGQGAKKSRGLVEDLVHTMGDAVKFTLVYGAAFKAISFVGELVALPFTLPAKIFEGAVALGKESTELVNSARTFGVSLRDWQRLQYAFTENHLEPKLMGQSLERLNRAVVASVRHGKDQAVAFKVVGVSVLDSQHKLRPMSQILGDVADGYSRLTNATKRDYVAQLLFGRSANELDPILRNGSKGLKAYGDEAERLGLVLSDDKLLSGKQLDKDWRDFTETLGGLRRELLGDLLPVFTSLVEQGTEFVQLHRPEIVKDITDFATNLKAHLPELKTALANVMTAGLNLIENVDWVGLSDAIVKVANAIAFLFGKDKEGSTRAFSWVGTAWQATVAALPELEPIDDLVRANGLKRQSGQPDDRPRAPTGAQGQKTLALAPSWQVIDPAHISLAPAFPTFGAPIATGGYPLPGAQQAGREQADRREPFKGQIDLRIQDDRTTVGRIWSNNPELELSASRGLLAPGW